MEIRREVALLAFRRETAIFLPFTASSTKLSIFNTSDCETPSLLAVSWIDGNGVLM